MRSCFRGIAVIALGVGLLGGCSDDPGPTGGTSGTGGDGGTGGTPECASPEDCDDDGDECTAALCTGGTCQTTPLDDGAVCTEGECHQGACTPVFPCTEQGIRDAIAEGGGPHFFDCVGPTTVATEAQIVIDNDVILDGEGELTVDGQGDHRVFRVENGVETELRGVTVTGGFAEGDFPDNSGGGIYISNTGTLTLTNSTVSDNTAQVGGGINNSGTLTLTDSTVSDNSDGGISNNGTLTLTDSTVSDNTAQVGGGITNNGTLTLTNSTVSGNTAQVYGGGISNNGTLTLTNGTVSGNNAGRDGGGIYISNTGTLTLTNGTVSGNTVGRDGGGIYNSGTLTLTNGTVSGNTAIDEGYGIYNEGTVTLTNTLMDDPCAVNSPTSLGGNLESPGNTCGLNRTTDQVNVSADDLKLGPLAANGGDTMTHALGAGSVAIDHIPAVDCEVDEDQRGQPRPETGGSMCDVGAFEVQP